MPICRWLGLNFYPLKPLLDMIINVPADDFGRQLVHEFRDLLRVFPNIRLPECICEPLRPRTKGNSPRLLDPCFIISFKSKTHIFTRQVRGSQERSKYPSSLVLRWYIRLQSRTIDQLTSKPIAAPIPICAVMACAFFTVRYSKPT